MRARDALDFSLVAATIGRELHGHGALGSREPMHHTSLEAAFGNIEVLTDLELLLVLESALHEELRQICIELTERTGTPHRYEIERLEDHVSSTLIAGNRRLPLRPVRLREVSRFP